MTPFQTKCAAALAKAPNGQLNTVNLAHRVGSNNVAVTSAMRSLERQGLAGSIRSGDSQWALLIWFMRRNKSVEFLNSE